MRALRTMWLLPLCAVLLAPSAPRVEPRSDDSGCAKGTVECCGGCFTPSYCRNHPSC